MARNKGIRIVDAEFNINEEAGEFEWISGKKKYTEVATMDFRGDPGDLMHQVNTVLRDHKCGFSFIQIQDGTDQYVFAVETK